MALMQQSMQKVATEKFMDFMRNCFTLAFWALQNFWNDFQGGSSNETCLHMACRIDAAKGERCLMMLLKSGADPNMTMSDGRTPLHIAAGEDG